MTAPIVRNRAMHGDTFLADMEQDLARRSNPAISR
jgi:hypothetical protein